MFPLPDDVNCMMCKYLSIQAVPATSSKS